MFNNSFFIKSNLYLKTSFVSYCCRNESSHIPHSMSVQSSQSVPMLKTVLETDTSQLHSTSNGLLRNGNVPPLSNGVLKNSDSNNSTGSLKSALKDTRSGGSTGSRSGSTGSRVHYEDSRVHYDDNDSGCHSNGSLKGGQPLLSGTRGGNGVLDEDTDLHSNESLKGHLIPKDNTGLRVNFEDEAIVKDEQHEDGIA